MFVSDPEQANELRKTGPALGPNKALKNGRDPEKCGGMCAMQRRRVKSHHLFLEKLSPPDCRNPS